MRKLIVFLILVSIIGCRKNIPTPVVNNSWIEDIKFIQQELPVRHVNLFSKISQQEFNSEIEDLIEKAPRLETYDIICELMKIFAKIGDSHTGIHNENNLDKFNIAPLKFEVFDDGIYIVEIEESAQKYLKQKVTAINEVPINIVQERISIILPHENDNFVKSAIPQFLRLYGILEALNITDSTYSYTITFENGAKIKFSGGTSPNYIFSSCYLPDKTPLYLQQNDLNYWYKILDDNIVYLQYNTCFDMAGNHFADFVQTMFNELENKPIDKFIIDIRLNSGGSSSIITLLIEELKRHENLEGKIYACIGDATFSSGVLAAISLKNNLNAILVGEPTGAKPNHYGSIQEFILPNSEFVVRYSTKYISSYHDDEVNTLQPDYFVENYSYDSFSGIDSCIEFIKSN